MNKKNLNSPEVKFGILDLHIYSEKSCWNIFTISLMNMPMWYKIWDNNCKSVVLSIGYPKVKSGWLKKTNLSTFRHYLTKGFRNHILFKEYMLQVKIPIIRREKMKYIDFKGREWSVEKGDWISYQMLDKKNQQLLNKSTLKIFFYIISFALLTVYFWLV